ncbi:hypothetical protein [Roseobacter fucihabitans]|uniref:hypothetical protein n=1 Tax=Roseobacter fucihabitans TaxID=1537242 RepID=UPI001652E1C0|nr:hypothetical protein [Roseobacter litoralis]
MTTIALFFSLAEQGRNDAWNKARFGICLFVQYRSDEEILMHRERTSGRRAGQNLPCPKK